MKIEHIGPPTAELGLMEGTPPLGGRLATLENWLLAPDRRRTRRLDDSPPGWDPTVEGLRSVEPVVRRGDSANKA